MKTQAGSLMEEEWCLADWWLALERWLGVSPNRTASGWCSLTHEHRDALARYEAIERHGREV